MTETSLFAPAGAGAPWALFELAGRQLAYAKSEYNSTSICERAVEVPVGIFLLEQAQSAGKSALEIGAVLPHYRPGWPEDGHTVIDLHEVYPGVTNADVLTWEPPHLFDLIISISTLDHLHDYDEFREALIRISFWLKPDRGLLYVTLPFGQPASVGGGSWLDEFSLRASLWPPPCRYPFRITRDGFIPTAMWRMDKVNVARNLWAQVDDPTTPLLAYHGQSLFANSVYFLLWGDVEGWWHK